MARLLVRVFEQAPDLLRDLPRWEADNARHQAVAHVVELEQGALPPPLVQLGPGDLGLLVLDGLILRRTEVIGHAAVELVGSGDLFRPWAGDDEAASVPWSLDVEVCQPTSVAVLDRDFVRTISRWPEIAPLILERMAARATSLALQLAIARIRNLEDRLLCLLWHLADRWGREDSEGMVVAVRLSQQSLGDLALASRPSVSAALARLAERGLVRRSGPMQYRLYGSPPSELTDFARAR